MQLTDYAVYKDNNQPWTIEEIITIARSMGDNRTIHTGNIVKYTYSRSSDGEVYPWSYQDIENKTPIEYLDYLKLISKSRSKPPKQEKPMPNRNGKYLSLKIKDGIANTRSLIFQAHATGINDPRPFIKELINNEIKSLKQTLNDIDLYSIAYGHNVKLASLITFGRKLQKQFYDNLNYELTLQECINVYILLDELEQFHRAKEIHEEMTLQWIDPYIWIADYLTPSVLSIPKPKILFNSNKFKIYFEDGYLYFLDKKPKIEYKAEIKLDVKSNTYYI